MAFILPIEEPWTSQPQVAVGIDPITPNLAAWLPSNKLSIGNSRLTETNSGAIATSAIGIAYKGGGTAYLKGGIPPITAYPFVIGGVFLPGTSDCQWAGIGGGAGVFNRFLIGQLGSSGQKILVEARPTDSGSTMSIYGSSLGYKAAVADKPVCVVALMRNATDVVVFVDGKKYLNSFGSPQTFSGFGTVGVGCSVTNGGVYSASNGGTGLVFYGNADPGDAYWQSISTSLASPWQIFAP